MVKVIYFKSAFSQEPARGFLALIALVPRIRGELLNFQNCVNNLKRISIFEPEITTVQLDVVKLVEALPFLPSSVGKLEKRFKPLNITCVYVFRLLSGIPKKATTAAGITF